MPARANIICYVGRDEACRHAFGTAFASGGDTFTVQFFDQGRAVIDYIQSEAVKVVVSEGDLEDMPGLMLLAEVRKRNAEIPFFLVGDQFEDVASLQNAFSTDITGIFPRRTIDVLARQLIGMFEQEEIFDREAIEASEAEQWRIGRELHDDLGQRLTSIGMFSYNLMLQLEEEGSQHAETAEEIYHLIKDADQLARDLSHGIILGDLEEEELYVALQRLARESEHLYGIRCWVETDKKEHVNDNTAAIYLLRIAQEAINNAVTHGHASRVVITLRKENQHTQLQIRDNGSGFSGDLDQVRKKGMGLRIMRYRARALHGSLIIANGPDGGAVVTCTVPLEGGE